MYSAEQRKKAIETFARFGCSAADTIAELGYPSRVTLRNWWKEYQISGDEFLERRHRRPKYSDEEKQGTVDYYLKHGKSLARAIRAMGSPSRSCPSHAAGPPSRATRPGSSRRLRPASGRSASSAAPPRRRWSVSIRLDIPAARVNTAGQFDRELGKMRYAKSMLKKSYSRSAVPAKASSSTRMSSFSTAGTGAVGGINEFMGAMKLYIGWNS